MTSDHSAFNLAICGVTNEERSLGGEEAVEHVR